MFFFYIDKTCLTRLVHVVLKIERKIDTQGMNC